MLFNTNWLAELFPTYQGEAKKQIEIEEVTTDSRRKGNAALFIPIVGDNFDGHTFAEQAIENGAVAMLWDKDKQLIDVDTDIPIFFVNDTLQALQDLAFKYKNEINPITIGVTGSNGKTTTKDLTAAIAKTSYRTHYTSGNFNNHIGLPLTILSMERDTEVLILEMGMSDFGEIDLLTKIAKPDHAIITNIGESHIEFLGSREGIAKAKLEIVNGLKEDGVLIVDGDEELLQHISIEQKIVKNGFQKTNDYVLSHVIISPDGTTFNMSDGFTYFIPLLGMHHAKNASFALTIGKLLNISPEKCNQAFKELERTGMRFELVKGKNGVSIINDAYNASPTSMKAAIEVVKEMDDFQQKIVVLGDILELGDYAEFMHRSIAQVIEPPINAVFTYGDHAKYIASELENNRSPVTCVHFSSKEKLVKALGAYLTKESLILFKASRGLRFETMIEMIQTEIQ